LKMVHNRRLKRRLSFLFRSLKHLNDRQFLMSPHDPKRTLRICPFKQSVFRHSTERSEAPAWEAGLRFRASSLDDGTEELPWSLFRRGALGDSGPPLIVVALVCIDGRVQLAQAWNLCLADRAVDNMRDAAFDLALYAAVFPAPVCFFFARHKITVNSICPG